jgi:hypothetical protein
VVRTLVRAPQQTFSDLPKRASVVTFLSQPLHVVLLALPRFGRPSISRAFSFLLLSVVRGTTSHICSVEKRQKKKNAGLLCYRYALRPSLNSRDDWHPTMASAPHLRRARTTKPQDVHPVVDFPCVDTVSSRYTHTHTPPLYPPPELSAWTLFVRTRTFVVPQYIVVL